MSCINKRTVLSVILAILLIGWMALIFYFSCEDGEKSGKTSADTATNITEIVMPSKSASETEKIVLEHQKVIRKSAHFLVYTVLGFLAVTFLSVASKLDLKNKLILSFVFSFFYAATDELHQYFVSGRTGVLADICLDTIGALTAIALFLAAEKICVFWKRKKSCIS